MADYGNVGIPPPGSDGFFSKPIGTTNQSLFPSYLNRVILAGDTFPVIDRSGSIGGTVSVEGTATEGIRVLLRYQGAVVACTYTNASGVYSFPEIPASHEFSVVMRSPDGANYNDIVYLLPAV